MKKVTASAGCWNVLVVTGSAAEEAAEFVVQDADALVVITEWNEFRALSLTRLRDAMCGRVLIDLRNVYDPIAMRRAGFDYHCVGRAEKT